MNSFVNSLVVAILATCAPVQADSLPSPEPAPPQLHCYPGQIPQMDDRGRWFCNGALERVFLPIRAGIAEFNLGELQPMECMTAYSQEGHAAFLEEVYSLTASLDPRLSTPYGVMDRPGTLILQGAYAEPGNLVVKLCNLHPEEFVEVKNLYVRWIAIHADHPYP